MRAFPIRLLFALVISSLVLGMLSVAAAAGNRGDGSVDNPFEYWSADRIASAVPRDLVIDHRGLGYLRSVDGRLQPYGHSVAAEAAPLRALPVKGALQTPSGGTDLSPVATTITLSPNGDTIGSSHTFTARVSVPGGARQVSAFVALAGSSSFQKFRMSYTAVDAGEEIWQLNLQGFGEGAWQWYVEVKDNGPRGGSTHSYGPVPFTVSIGGSSGVTSQRWTGGGDVQTAAGRILFQMPDGYYVCSGTAVTDGTGGRSVVLTAAHCVYDDVANVFSSNAIFIPNQDDGGADGTDFDCDNDPMGCWAIDHGVVDVNWTTRTFPDNVAWDYAYYVVSDTGAHSGTAADAALDGAAGSLAVDFTAPEVAIETTALGYSYSDDPNFMYCQEAMGTNGSANYWLDSCDLTGGSSGGPWLQPLLDGNGPVISVNSWGYTTRAGMAGPKLHDNSAGTLFGAATTSDLASTDRGFVIDPDAGTPTPTPTPTPDPTPTPTPTPDPDPDQFALSVVANKIKGEKIATLSWTDGAAAIDIYRDGSVVVQETENNGSYVDATGLKGGGTNTWQVCESGVDPGNCSAVVTINW